jgi:hypothetical protein
MAATCEDFMSTTIVLSEPKSFSFQRSMLGVPVAIWAMAFLLIAVAANLHMPVVTFGSLELLPPF